MRISDGNKGEGYGIIGNFYKGNLRGVFISGISAYGWETFLEFVTTSSLVFAKNCNFERCFVFGDAIFLYIA